jgi:hypothetical protein
MDIILVSYFRGHKFLFGKHGIIVDFFSVTMLDLCGQIKRSYSWLRWSAKCKPLETFLHATPVATYVTTPGSNDASPFRIHFHPIQVLWVEVAGIIH